MALAKRLIAALLLTAAAAFLLASSAMAGERVGVVTNIEGTATVARLSEPGAQPLQFKDAVFLRDRITTGERSFVRVLLGGKATVTARERSVLTITEVPGVATVQLGEGRISVAVSKALMKPGDVIEIKTPNAVTAIRGTVVVAEVEPAGSGYRSTITILRGLVDVTRLDPTAGPVGPAVKVGALQRVSVVGAGPVPQPTSITQEAARGLASEFSMVPKDVPAASVEPLNAAMRDATIREILQATGGAVSVPTGSTGGTVTTVTSTVSNVTGGVVGTASGVVGGLAGTATSAVGGLAGTATGVVGGLTGTTTGVVGGLTGTATGVTGSLTGAVGGAVGSLAPAPAPVVTRPPAPIVSPVLNTVTNTTSAVTNGLLSGLKK
jgi:FecR-like protein